MKIPNCQNAFIDERKLRDYALNPDHPVGQHKARLFLAFLNLTAADLDSLIGILLDVVQTHDAKIGKLDEFGQRYRIDFLLEWEGNQAVVRSGWVIRTDEEFPRLVTCYPLED